MILILIAIVVAVIASVVLFKYSGTGYKDRHIFAGVAGTLLGIASGFAAIFHAVMGYSWFAAEYKAGIINREYNTNYTQAEVFYASDVIETVRQLSRNRYEINGNLLKESKEK